ncbi:hypothetical protein PG984_015412 [Apiospora sp. TS-2023a]
MLSAARTSLRASFLAQSALLAEALTVAHDYRYHDLVGGQSANIVSRNLLRNVAETLVASLLVQSSVAAKLHLVLKKRDEGLAVFGVLGGEDGLREVGRGFQNFVDDFPCFFPSQQSQPPRNGSTHRERTAGSPQLTNRCFAAGRRPHGSRLAASTADWWLRIGTSSLWGNCRGQGEAEQEGCRCQMEPHDGTGYIGARFRFIRGCYA